MKYLRTLTVIFASILLLAGIYIGTANAQPGRASWQGNRGRHLGWTIGRHRGWNRERRQRIRLNRTWRRSTRDAYINRAEDRRLSRQYNRYQRTYYRNRMNYRRNY